MNGTETLLTPVEAAERWRVSRSTVHRWIASGHLAALRLPTGTVRIPLSAVEAFESHCEAS